MLFIDREISSDVIYAFSLSINFKGLRGFWLWTVTVFSFALFLRGEEPLRLKVKNIKLPRSFDGKSAWPKLYVC